MARISNNSSQRATGDVKHNNDDRKDGPTTRWAFAFFSVNSAPGNDDNVNNASPLQKVSSKTAGDKGNVLGDVTIDSDNGSTITPTTSNGFTISSPRVFHSSHILSLRSEEEDDNDSLTFYRKSSGLAPGRPTYHNSRSALNLASDHLSSLSPKTRIDRDPITLNRSKSANSLLDPPLDQCLAPIPPRLWGSRQQHACKHAAGQVAALVFDNQHHLHHHHHHLHHLYHENSPAVFGPALNFFRKLPEPDITGPPDHETTLDYHSNSSSSSLSDSFSDSHIPPVEELTTPFLEPAFSVVQLEEPSEQHPELRASFCNASSPTEDNLLAERSCAALEEDPVLPPHRSSLPPLPPSPTSSHSEKESSTLASLTLDDFQSDPAMAKLRSSDSGASSRTRPEIPRPISTGTTGSHGTAKVPSSPHSISRMFSTKIRGLLHTRDRRASSPLNPTTPIVPEVQAEAQKPSSVSVPSTPRAAHPPVVHPVHPVHPGTVVQSPTEGYGMIPISNPFPQNGKDYAASVEPASGHSSYISMDSPTTRTETSQDSSTSTESTGIRSGRSSFQSLQEKRSGSPESPITPARDYHFARAEKTDTMDSIEYQYEDALDDAQSQEVPVFLDESSEVPNPQIPSVQVEAATPTMSKHNSRFLNAPQSRAPRPVSRSRSVSPATRRAPSFVAPIREEYVGGRETPSFLAPRPAPIPIPSSGSVKPALHPGEGGSKPLRANTMSSRSSNANSSRAPLSLTPRVRKNTVTRPSTASRPGTSFSVSSNRSMHSPKMPGSPREGDLAEIDEVSLGAPKSPAASAFNPDNAASPAPLRGKLSPLVAASIPHEIAVPPPFDARSFRTAPASPTAPSEYSFTTGLSPKRIPDDMQMRPTVFHTEGSDADVSIPVFLSPQSPVAEPRRSRTVSLRHAFTRLNSHVNKRGTPPHITPDIISRPSTATRNGIPTHTADVPATILEYDNPENHQNPPPISRPRANSSATQPSGSSFSSRWKSVHSRSSSNPSNPPPAYQAPTASVAPTFAPGILHPVPLTDEDRSEIARMPGTIFLKTAIKTDGPDGELTIQEHRLKPRKGMQGSGAAGKCRFCRRGPFPNMWVCLDSCGFVMCRVCANESVQVGEAELF